MRVHMLQVCGHIKHVVVLVVLRIRVFTSVVTSVPTYTHFTCMWIPCNCSHCENGSFEVLSLHPPVGYSGPTAAVNESICNKIEKSWNPFVWGFTQRSNHNGLHRSIMNLCMRPLHSTFFEFLWWPPGSIPLPPSGRRTRWRLLFLVLPLG